MIVLQIFISKFVRLIWNSSENIRSCEQSFCCDILKIVKERGNAMNRNEIKDSLHGLQAKIDTIGRSL